MRGVLSRRLLGPLAVVMVVGLISPVATAALTGAIHTTDVTCEGVNINIFGSKPEVYLQGGPQGNQPNVPNGSYYVKVTDPSGAVLLGTSVGGLSGDTPFVVTNGVSNCIQVWDVLVNPDGDQGYDDTPNPGGVYKVTISTTDEFLDRNSKSDTFKVRERDGGPQTANLRIRKFYDANVNGINDDGQLIGGWRFRVQNTIDLVRDTPVDLVVDAPDTYTVTEFTPLEAGWLQTTLGVVNVDLNPGDDRTLEFGNVCLGGGNAKTIGYWRNTNGQARLVAADFSGGRPYALNAQPFFQNTWFTTSGFGGFPNAKNRLGNYLKNANAVEMKYMLSAQTAAMMLNVNVGDVGIGAYVYAPGVPSANAFGFTSIGALLADAVAALGGTDRAQQELIKTAIDDANNNLTFVQSTPCAFSFAEEI